MDLEMWDWKSDPEAPWWVKLRRARLHIDEVHERVRALDASGPWSIDKETTEDPDSWAFRFRIHRPIPADLRAAVGDAIANMRSALDYAAYELAVRHAVTLTPRQEKSTAFPICKDGAAFDRFFTEGRSGPIRAEIYGEAERLALRCVQPFALREEAQSVGVQWSDPADGDLLTDGAWALNSVWNIDKHRRLPELAWGRDDLFYWQGADQFAIEGWRVLVAPHSSLTDDQPILELRGAHSNGRPDVDLYQGIQLFLADDPSPYKAALGDRLEQLHQSLSGWVLPRIFATADGNRPPVMISFRPPE
jgi:hypothetical protein